MSDFFTKKQKKWWCDHCKKFIEYTNMSIDQHKRSKNHQKMVNHNFIYENRKARAKKLMESTGGVDHSTYSEIEQIEKAAHQSFNTQDSVRFESTNNQNNYINNKKNNSGGGILSHKETYNISNNLLDEIKHEKLQAEHQDLFNKRYLKKKKSREWGGFYDDASKKPYYYNFLTRISQWEKPVNYDGPEEEKKIENEPDNQENSLIIEESGNNLVNGNTGVIGKWEDVDPKDSFFKKFKAEEVELIENFYSEVDFLKKIKQEEEEEEDDEEEEFNNGTIDDYIIGKKEKIENDFPKLENNEIIDINEKLKKRDYDLRYVNQLFTIEDKNLNYIKPKADELLDGQTISFTFKTRKDEYTKKIKKPIFFDED